MAVDVGQRLARLVFGCSGLSFSPDPLEVIFDMHLNYIIWFIHSTLLLCSTLPYTYSPRLSSHRGCKYDQS